MLIRNLAIAARVTPAPRNETASPTRMLAGRCPNCGGDLRRIRRYPIDRLVSLVVPVRRFRCEECTWEGLYTSIH